MLTFPSTSKTNNIPVSSSFPVNSQSTSFPQVNLPLFTNLLFNQVADSPSQRRSLELENTSERSSLFTRPSNQQNTQSGFKIKPTIIIERDENCGMSKSKPKSQEAGSPSSTGNSTCSQEIESYMRSFDQVVASVKSANLPSEEKEDIIAGAEERLEYAKIFSEMQANLAVTFKRQLEFIGMLKEMNEPKNAIYWPMLDKINPLMAGVMAKKEKIDSNTYQMMKRTHGLLNAGPSHKTFKNKKSPQGKQGGLRMNANGKRVANEFDESIQMEVDGISLNDTRKKIKRDMAAAAERNAGVEQMLTFILEDVVYIKPETGVVNTAKL